MCPKLQSFFFLIEKAEGENGQFQSSPFLCEH